MLTSIDPSTLSSSLIVHVQNCSAPQIFSKWQMWPFDLCSFCSCHVFSYNSAQFLLLKRVKCPPFFVFFLFLFLFFFFINRDLYYHYITYNTFTTKLRLQKKLQLRIKIPTINTTYTATRLASRIRRLDYNHLQ